MKIDVQIDNINGRYQVQIDALGFTSLEEEKLREFGEPLVDLGGTFVGTVTRPDVENTVVTLTGGGGLDAEIIPVLDKFGAIVSYTVVDGGSNYTSAPTVEIVGDGNGANAVAVLTGDAVTSVTVIDEGTGYHLTPVAVTFELPSQLLRLRTDFPIKKVFDLDDTLEADAQAKVWADTMVARITTAKQLLMSRTSPFEGETLTTV